MGSDQDPAKPTECLEVCWRVRIWGGSVFECGIYTSGAWMEVRFSLGEDTVYSQVVPTIESGRQIAERWRVAVLAKGGVEEISV